VFKDWERLLPSSSSTGVLGHDEKYDEEEERGGRRDIEAIFKRSLSISSISPYGKALMFQLSFLISLTSPITLLGM